MMNFSLSLIEPDIAGNVGAMLRTAACFGVPVHIAEPCGFPFSDRAMQRAGMDYAERVNVTRHTSRHALIDYARARGHRMILLTTRATNSLFAHAFAPGDMLLMGSESTGAPDDVHGAADILLRIPMLGDVRSLNVSVAAGIAIAEATRQLGSAR
jgi:tRNA (cytidine/uridine-2'-O-)-methyltransferase